MGYRVLFLANPVKLSVKKEQLMIDNGEVTRVPLEDIECIVCDTPQLNITARLLVITEKQYEKMELIIGNLVKEEEHASFEQLSIF
ncbi:MAG: hypothetical protein UFA98_05665 [Ruminococcus sp.]|nr:hypothetical protein [Ruminococcus sp.]